MRMLLMTDDSRMRTQERQAPAGTEREFQNYWLLPAREEDT